MAAQQQYVVVCQRRGGKTTDKSVGEVMIGSVNLHSGADRLPFQCTLHRSTQTHEPVFHPTGGGGGSGTLEKDRAAEIYLTRYGRFV